METTVNERIKICFENIDRNAFCKTTNTPYSTLSSIINGKSNPSYKIIESILTYDPAINPYWLIMGIGKSNVIEENELMKEGFDIIRNSFSSELEKDESINQLIDAFSRLNNKKYYKALSIIDRASSLKHQESPTLEIASEPEISYKKELKEAVPYYDIDVSAGIVDLFNDEKESPSGWVNFPDFPKSDAVVNVYGESMHDYISNGNKVAIRQIKDLDIIEFGQIYVIVTEDYRLVKYLRKGNDKNSVKLVSHNSEFDTFEIQKSKIKGLFLVTYVFKPRAN